MEEENVTFPEQKFVTVKCESCGIEYKSSCDIDNDYIACCLKCY